MIHVSRSLTFGELAFKGASGQVRGPLGRPAPQPASLAAPVLVRLGAQPPSTVCLRPAARVISPASS